MTEASAHKATEVNTPLSGGGRGATRSVRRIFNYPASAAFFASLALMLSTLELGVAANSVWV